MKTRVSVFVQCVCMAILGFITAVPAQAGLMHNVNITPDSEYIDYGLNFPWVVPIGRTEDGGPLAFGGSGVVVAPGVVLLSAHQIFADAGRTTPYDGFAVRLTSNFVTDPGELFTTSNFVVHPDFNDVESGPDLALLFFDQQFQVSPLEIYTGSHVPGTPYDIAGFGYYGTPATGLVAIDGARRAGTNLLTDVDTPEGYMRARFLSPSEVGFQELGILGTPGDSGGGWFVNINGEIQLAGISSDWSGFAGYGGRTSATYFTPELASWVHSEIEAHAVPEPASGITFLVGMGALAIRRRKARQIGGN